MYKTKIKLVAFPLVLVMVLTLLACRSEPLNPHEPQVLILSPNMNWTASSTEVEIRLFVENFDLVDNIGQENITGQGHILYYRDVTPPLVAGENALTDPDTYKESKDKSYRWADLDSGKHTFWIQLVNNDNTVLQPPAAVWINVTIK